jgi:hypothetical protein
MTVEVYTHDLKLYSSFHNIKRLEKRNFTFVLFHDSGEVSYFSLNTFLFKVKED